MARLLWVADYGLGSCFPIVPIVSELGTRRHEIVMFAGPESEAGEETFRKLGFEFRPNRTVPASFRLEPESYLDLTHKRAADVLDLLRAESFDAVVVDCLQHGAGLAAEAAGVPWISYIHYAIDESAAMVDHRLRRLKGHAEFRDVDHRRWWDRARRTVGLEPDPRPLEESRWCTFSSSSTFVLGLPELALRPDAELPSYVHRVGPVMWEPPWDGQRPAWMDRLGRDRPAVLAANSTTGDKDEQTILDLGEGLAEDDLDVVATVTTTRTLPPLPANTIVTSFLPHSLLISKASAIVCSAGYGLTTKAAWRRSAARSRSTIEGSVRGRRGSKEGRPRGSPDARRAEPCTSRRRGSPGAERAQLRGEGRKAPASGCALRRADGRGQSD